MKVFHIVGGWCHLDATSQFPRAASTVGRFPPSDLFVEAPDHGFEGWGYDPEQEGDARFLQPEPPEGWLYDAGTGTFYPEGDIAPSQQPTDAQRLAALEAENKELRAKLAAAVESGAMLEDCIVEMAGVVYA